MVVYYQKQQSPQHSHVLLEQHIRLKRHMQESIFALVVAVGSYCWWYTMQIAGSVGAVTSWRSVHNKASKHCRFMGSKVEIGYRQISTAVVVRRFSW